MFFRRIKSAPLRCGMNDFIGKPVEFEELREGAFLVSRSPVSRTEQGRSALEQ